ncbi:MAG: hypothetical protein EBZ48_06170 [Proteobacteria bacterium]|nr:hypothetical protein [Pseudomonadota bacterium]
MIKQLQSLVVVAFGSIMFGCSTIKADPGATSAISDYDSCVAAGFPILKTYPPRCIGKGGREFLQNTTRPVGPGNNQAGQICKNQCGDGVCQQIVCLGSGCPCAETPQNCPQDCAESSFQ